jgi:hypothetical protein
MPPVRIPGHGKHPAFNRLTLTVQSDFIASLQRPTVAPTDDGKSVVLSCQKYRRGSRPLPGLDEHGGEEIVYLLSGTFVDQYRTSDPAR